MLKALKQVQLIGIEKCQSNNTNSVQTACLDLYRLLILKTLTLFAHHSKFGVIVINQDLFGVCFSFLLTTSPLSG